MAGTELKHQTKLRPALYTALSQSINYRVFCFFFKNMFNHTVLNINIHKLYLEVKLYHYLNFVLGSKSILLLIKNKILKINDGINFISLFYIIL